MSSFGIFTRLDVVVDDKSPSFLVAKDRDSLAVRLEAWTNSRLGG